METKPFNWFAQELLTEALAAAGRTRPERKVARSTQFGDFTFLPGPRHGALRGKLGLLGWMTTEPCLIETFHGTPGLAEVLECQSKQLVLHHQQDLRAIKARQDRPRVPWHLWIVSPGRPEGVMRGLSLAPNGDSVPGMYGGSVPANPVGLVVTRELPQTRETLLLRLLGADEVLQVATHEVAELAAHDPIREWAGPLLVELKLKVAQDPEVSQSEKGRLDMATLTLLEAYGKRIHRGALRQGKAEGKALGKAEGKADAILSVLRARRVRVTSSAQRQIVSCADHQQLEQWLTRAVSATEVSDLFDLARKAPRKASRSKSKSH